MYGAGVRKSIELYHKLKVVREWLDLVKDSWFDHTCGGCDENKLANRGLVDLVFKTAAIDADYAPCAFLRRMRFQQSFRDSFCLERSLFRDLAVLNYILGKI
jgi:hypothetical protein